MESLRALLLGGGHRSAGRAAKARDRLEAAVIAHGRVLLRSGMVVAVPERAMRPVLECGKRQTP